MRWVWPIHTAEAQLILFIRRDHNEEVGVRELSHKHEQKEEIWFEG